MLRGHERTLSRSTGTAAAKVVDNSSITLDNTVNGKIASKAGIGDLLVFQALDGRLNGIDSGSSSLEKLHGQAGSTSRVSMLSTKSKTIVVLHLDSRTHCMLRDGHAR